MSKNEYLTKEDLRNLLKISRSTLDLYMKRNEVPYIKLQRRVLFRRADIDKWLESKIVK
jgi:excisionase family DNA binding protein